MRGSMKLVSMLLVLCLMLGALPLAMAEEDVDADLTCTITLGNWPADTAAEAEKALFESYRETMKKQYPNVTLVPDYYSYTLSSYVPMAKGGTAPSIFQPPFTDPQLLISQHLVGDGLRPLEGPGGVAVLLEGVGEVEDLEQFGGRQVVVPEEVSERHGRACHTVDPGLCRT